MCDEIFSEKDSTEKATQLPAAVPDRKIFPPEIQLHRPALGIGQHMIVQFTRTLAARGNFAMHGCRLGIENDLGPGIGQSLGKIRVVEKCPCVLLVESADSDSESFPHRSVATRPIGGFRPARVIQRKAHPSSTILNAVTREVILRLLSGFENLAGYTAQGRIRIVTHVGFDEFFGKSHVVIDQQQYSSRSVLDAVIARFLGVGRVAVKIF